MQPASGSSRQLRWLELAGVTLFFGLAAVTIAHLTVAWLALPTAPIAKTAVVAGAMLAALLFADLASGLVHWAADNWGSADWPILGSAFIEPFRMHHLDAKDITHHAFLELNGNNCIVSLPLFWVAQYSLSLDLFGLFAGTFWLGTAIWVLATNQFHAWAHADVAPAAARWLQRHGLILSAPHHDHHHALPHASHYCITTGWLNSPLRALRVFEALEWSITRLTGVQANHHRVRQYGNSSAEPT